MQQKNATVKYCAGCGHPHHGQGHTPPKYRAVFLTHIFIDVDDPKRLVIQLQSRLIIVHANRISGAWTATNCEN